MAAAHLLALQITLKRAGERMKKRVEREKIDWILLPLYLLFMERKESPERTHSLTKSEEEEEAADRD